MKGARADAREARRSQPRVPWLDRRVFWQAAIVFVCSAALLRVAAAGDNFWLDEVWSLQLAGGLRQAGDVFSLTESNNHHLVTLWMYAWGVRDSWFIYRVPSLVAGVGTVVLAG